MRGGQHIPGKFWFLDMTLICAGIVFKIALPDPAGVFTLMFSNLQTLPLLRGESIC